MKTETTAPARVFYVAVQLMPAGTQYRVPVLARSLAEAREKATSWPHHRAPGAGEHYQLAP